MKKILIIAALAAGVASLKADESAFQLSLTPDIAIHPKTTEISGVSLDIWGENPQHSFNLGFVNGSTGDSKGFSWGLVNYDDSYTGVQWGIVNYSEKSFIDSEWKKKKDVLERLPKTVESWVSEKIKQQKAGEWE